MSVARSTALAAALRLAGCAAPRNGQIVRVAPYQPGSVASPLSRVARAIVQVQPFGDLPAGTGGGLADARQVVHFAVAPPPARLLHAAVSAELQAAGHQIGGAGAPVVVRGAVQRFDVTASQTALYWAVEAQIAVAVTAARNGRTLSHSYVSRCQDVAYAAPAPDAMAPLVARCVGDAVRQFRDDQAMAALIGG